MTVSGSELGLKKVKVNTYLKTAQLRNEGGRLCHSYVGIK